MIPLIRATIVYLPLTLVSIALLDDAHSDSTVWLAFLPQVVACIWAGWTLRDWAWIAPALVALTVLLAGLFGTPDSDPRGEGLPIVLVELLASPVYLGLIVLGVAIQRRVEHKKAAGTVSGPRT